MKLKTQSKGSRTGVPLHQFIATGGKPAQFKGCKGVSSVTVPKVKKSK